MIWKVVKMLVILGIEFAVFVVVNTKPSTGSHINDK